MPWLSDCVHFSLCDDAWEIGRSFFRLWADVNMSHVTQVSTSNTDNSTNESSFKVFYLRLDLCEESNVMRLR